MISLIFQCPNGLGKWFEYNSDVQTFEDSINDEPIKCSSLNGSFFLYNPDWSLIEY